MNGIMVSINFLQPLVGWLAVLSLGTFILSLVLIPWVVGKLEQDCFLKLYQNDRSTTRPSPASVFMLMLRNGLGLLLILAGIAMLFLPGQGLLTMLLGALLLSFPGKHRLITRLVRQPKIQHSLDWIRKKRGKVPFIWP